MSSTKSDAPLQLDEGLWLLPVVHGSGDSAIAVRRWLLDHPIDCVAVPLPESFRQPVEHGVSLLPSPSIVVQRPNRWHRTQWQPNDPGDPPSDISESTYVAIDPCQSVIAAIRWALGERIPIEYLDIDSLEFVSDASIVPDPYALRNVSIAAFAAALLPQFPRPSDPRVNRQLRAFSRRLKQLKSRYNRIVCLCSIQSWPWVRDWYLHPPQAGLEPIDTEELEDSNALSDPEWFAVDPKSLLFLFGELPRITGYYEEARQSLEDDENLSIDGVKKLLLEGRSHYYDEFKGRSRKIPPALLRKALHYMRNLSLIEKRMTPDLYSIAVAAKQVVGDQYALHIVERANHYPFPPASGPQVRMGLDQLRLPDGEVLQAIHRLPGPPLIWRSLELKRRPELRQQHLWRKQWNPMQQCSWPPEDARIESFRTRVVDRARALMGADLARSEKFSTSFKDGLDIRETLRHWHDGSVYVRVLPPSIGKIDAAVMLFDSPADPRIYPWRTTWYAEHHEESTLGFFATSFADNVVGPGVCMAQYGGVLFLFPPRSIPNVWTDRRLDFCTTLEERLVAAACLHSHNRQVAIASWIPPGSGWKKLAKRFSKTLIHVPWSHFSSESIQQLRTVHVLNGRHVRSYAADFIRRP